MEVLTGRIYRHYKGDYYIVLNIALNTETEEQMVIYKALYEDGEVFARPYDSFVQEIKNENQDHRFELQEIKSKNNLNKKEKSKMKQLTYIMVKPEFAEKQEVIDLCVTQRNSLKNIMQNTSVEAMKTQKVSTSNLKTTSLQAELMEWLWKAKMQLKQCVQSSKNSELLFPQFQMTQMLI